MLKQDENIAAGQP